jgi:hypothetical protein
MALVSVANAGLNDTLAELEERQMNDSYLYAVAFIKSRYVLQRHQMMIRHEQVSCCLTWPSELAENKHHLRKTLKID